MRASKTPMPVLAYGLMPNHFYVLLLQNEEKGI